MPLSVADAQALPVLFKTMSGMRLAFAVILVAVVLATILCMLRPKRLTALSITLAVCYVFALPTLISQASPLIDLVLPVQTTEHKMLNGAVVKSNQESDPVAFLRGRGPVVYLASEWQSIHAENGGPSRSEVDALVLRPWQPVRRSPTRNIHVVLLESLWDTSLLSHHQTDRDPLDARFRAMWEAAGRSYALSPTFGGVTANAEFEVLCGFPAPNTSVAFINLLHKPSPCLPAALAAHGYTTIASHAHEASNWNRNTAYKEAGFNTYRPISAFDLDDMEGPYLFDGSFFQQNLKYQESLPLNKPIFDYQVSLSSHWAFARNLQSRPNLVKVFPADLTLLNDYVNAIAYSTTAFMDWTEALLAKDPDALIIVFGDHAPVLTASASDKDPYIGVNANDQSAFDSENTRKQLGMSRTPLLVIDGEEGPVRIANDTPLYELPQLISKLLGDGDLIPQSSEAGPMVIRPFLGHLLVETDGTWRDCAKGRPSATSPACVNAQTRTQLLRTLRRDATLGGGYYVARKGAGAMVTTSRRSGMKVDSTWKTCSFDVAQFGPQQGYLGEGVNVLPNGSSTIWVSLKHLRGQPILRMGGVAADPVYGPKVITGSFNTPTLYAAPGALPVTLQCPGEPPTLIGEVKIVPRP